MLSFAVMFKRFLLLVVIVSPLSGPGVHSDETASSQRLVFGSLPCKDDSNPRSLGVRQLAWELVKRTSIEAEPESRDVDPSDVAIFETPFLFWSCKGAVAPLDEKAKSNLRRFLKLGGFLLVDDPSSSKTSDFSISVRNAIGEILPEKEFSEIPGDHVLFKTFFLISRPFGRVANSRLESVSVGDRLAVVYSANDLLGAMNRDFYGNWEHACQPGGEIQREESIRLGINIVFYAMCLDYKDDRVHLPFILKRRRL